MKRLSIVLSILMFQAAMALPALAQSSSDEFKPGAYVQGQFAAQFLTGDASQITTDSGYYGGGIAGGYFLTHWLALQGRANFIAGPQGADALAGLDKSFVFQTILKYTKYGKNDRKEELMLSLHSRHLNK